MTKINLAEIEARTEKATAGIWVVVGKELWCGGNLIARFPNEADAVLTSTLHFVLDDMVAEIKQLRDVVQAYKTRLGHAEDLLESAQEDEIRGHLYKDIERYFGGRFI